MRKMLLFGLVAAGLLLAVWFIQMPSIGTVSATQWTGLSNPTDVAIGDYNNDGLSDLGMFPNFYILDLQLLLHQYT